MPKRKVSCVLLAAGMSKRFPGNKLLAPLIDDKTVLEKTLENTLKAHIEELVIVLGSEGEKIEKVLKKFLENPAPKDSRIRLKGPTNSINQVSTIPFQIIFNGDYHRGQFTSVKKGLTSLEYPADGVIFCLGDQPLVSSEIINSLINKFKTTSCDVVYPTYKGQRGNPVLFHETLFDKLKELDESNNGGNQNKDRGGRSVLKKAKNPCSVELSSPYILMDIDTEEDLEKVKKILKK